MKHKTDSNRPKIKIFGSFAQFFASGFGSGCAPKAPGTFGTLMAVPIWIVLVYYLQLTGWLYLLMVVITFIFGVWVCDVASKELGVHDHGGIVWDEFVGFFITMIGITVTLQNILLGFVLFRIFDIIKPFPIKWLDQKVAGGFGVMIDDVLAGIFALISLHLIHYCVALYL